MVKHFEDLSKKDISVTTIQLHSLHLEDLHTLISETLRMPIESILPLSIVVYDKTKGNPFFVGNFLNALYTKRLLVMLLIYLFNCTVFRL